jgi:hypothetical protein
LKRLTVLCPEERIQIVASGDLASKELKLLEYFVMLLQKGFHPAQFRKYVR